MRMTIMGRTFEGRSEFDCIWQYLLARGYPPEWEVAGRRLAVKIAKAQRRRQQRR